MCSIPTENEVCSIQLCEKDCQLLAEGEWFSEGTRIL